MLLSTVCLAFVAPFLFPCLSPSRITCNPFRLSELLYSAWKVWEIRQKIWMVSALSLADFATPVVPDEGVPLWWEYRVFSAWIVFLVFLGRGWLPVMRAAIVVGSPSSTIRSLQSSGKCENPTFFCVYMHLFPGGGTSFMKNLITTQGACQDAVFEDGQKVRCIRPL